MNLISHRGNLHGKDVSIENNSEQIEYVISQGYDCEIDVWYKNGNYYLGHDEPFEEISIKFLVDNHTKLWIHCKDKESLSSFVNSRWWCQLNYFYHVNDPCVLTSKGYVWNFPETKVDMNGIWVMPEWGVEKSEDDIKKWLMETSAFKHTRKLISGICSDYIAYIKGNLE